MMIIRKDAWFVFRQALAIERHADISAKVIRWLDTWSLTAPKGRLG